MGNAAALLVIAEESFITQVLTNSILTLFSWSCAAISYFFVHSFKDRVEITNERNKRRRDRSIGLISRVVGNLKDPAEVR